MKSMQFFSRAAAVISAFFLSVVSFAQEKGVDIDVNLKKDNAWYQQPWVWIVGIAVFVLLLAAILRGRSSAE
jgi:hypothetical protein